MTDYSEPYWFDEHDPPAKCYDYCQVCAYFEEDCKHGAKEDHYNWEEQDWVDNRLMYENELEYLEELPKRERK